MVEATYKTRHRINIATSVKGIITPEVTVEIIDGTVVQVAEEVERLYVEAQLMCAELQARKPADG